MAKKCIICGNEAEFCIKGSSECYCPGCAEEHFGDVNMLMKVEEEAQKLKSMLDEKIDDNTEPQA